MLINACDLRCVEVEDRFEVSELCNKISRYWKTNSYHYTYNYGRCDFMNAFDSIYVQLEKYYNITDI